ncbi:porin PorA family protein [Streptacidiphilus sp. PAMC 29251]
MRRSVILLTSGAVLLAVASPVTRFAVLPALRQVPSDLNLTEHYSGTADLLNSAALASGDQAHIFLTNVPVTGTQLVKVTSTHGSTAVMSDRTTVAGADGKALFGSAYNWAVNRVDLTAATPPAGVKADAHTGLVVGFPLQPKAVDYPFWDTSTQTTTTAKYTRTEKLNGRDSYVYTIHAAGPVKDPGTLAGLPKALPKATVGALAATQPAAAQQALAPALPGLPALAPLSYDATTDITTVVDTATGYLLDLTQKQTVRADVAGPSGAVPLVPVLSLDIHSTDGSVADNAHTAAGDASALNLLGVVAPIGLAVLALLLALAAVLVARRPRRTATPEPTPESAAESIPAE